MGASKSSVAAVEYTLTDIKNRFVEDNYTYSIQPLDSNGLCEVAGEGVTAQIDVDANVCTQVVIDYDKYGHIMTMRRINGLQIVFECCSDEVRIFVDDSLVHTLANKFKTR